MPLKFIPLMGLIFGLSVGFNICHASGISLANPAETRSEFRSREVWNLKALYPSTLAWEAERQALLVEIPKLRSLRGTLGLDATKLRLGLDQISDVKRRAMRLAVYASLLADENTLITENQALSQLSDSVLSQLGEATSFVSAEVAAIGAEGIKTFIASDPGLVKHQQALETVMRLAAHTLPASEEALLAAAAEPLQQAQDIYGLLTNAELPWPKIKIRDKWVVLDQEQYVAHRSDPNPQVREQVFRAFWPVFKAYERTLGAIYASNLKSNVFVARARKYPSAVAMAQSADNIPEAVYRTLVQEANAGLPTLHRLIALRSKVLGLKTALYSDLYVPLAKPAGSYTVASAEALTLQALVPLGSEYTQELKEAFTRGWMHSKPQRGKRSGAYMNPAAYDVHPYLLMSFNGDYNSTSTLAHEWGHAMHSVFSNAAQPFETAGYSIFVAEIPSTANELFLADHVLAKAQTREEKIFALSQELENLRTTFFRQAMFAEFELATHEAAQNGQALNGEAFSAIYLELLRRYHGHHQGVMQIDALYGIEWAYIPHFYSDFYVYQYATSVSAAAFFVENIQNEAKAGKTSTRDRFFALLRAGGSDDPYPLTRAAGVDLASPEPYRALLRRMNRSMDSLEALLKQSR